MKMHARQDQGRAADLVSWFYAVIDITDGELPWPATHDEHKTLKGKQKVTPEALCKSYPSEMVELFRYVDALGYYDDPDYEMMYGLLEQARGKVKQKDGLDWEKMGKSALKRISALDIQNTNGGEPAQVFYDGRDITSPPLCNVM
jgi:hypothetical protein